MTSYIKPAHDHDDLDFRWLDFVSDTEKRLNTALAGAPPQVVAERVDDLLRAVQEWADSHVRAQATALLSQRQSFTSTAATLGIGQVRLRRILGTDLETIRENAEPDELADAEDIRPLVAGARMAAQAST
jgi:hypothetical protein